MFQLLRDTYLNAVQNFFNILTAQFPETNDDQLNNIFISNLRDQNYKYIKDVKMSNASSGIGCKHLLKNGPRKNQPCGAKTAQGSVLCSKHNKNADPQTIVQHVEEEVEEKIDLSRIYIRPNQYRNFVYGDTGYIIKSATEKYVVAKEGKEGEWLPLTEQDKLIVKKKYKLRYKEIDFTKKGEQTNKDYIKNMELFKPEQEEPMMAKVTRMIPWRTQEEE